MNNCLPEVLKILSYFINNDDANIAAEMSSVAQWFETLAMSDICEDGLLLLSDELHRKHLLFQTNRIDAVANETLAAGSKIKQEVSRADRTAIIQQCVLLSHIRYNGHIPDEAVTDLRMMASLILDDDAIIEDIIRGLAPAEPSADKIGEMYKTLGLEPGADANAVKKAYRHIALTCHPDRLEGITESERQWAMNMLQTATEAKEALLRHLNENN